MTANNKEDTHRRRVAPAYLKRKGSIGKDGKRAPDRAITYLWVDGDRRQVHLGTWKSPQSRERFARVMSLYVQGEEQAALEAAKPERSPTDDTVTVEELVGQFLRHAEGYYRKPDGRPTGEHRNFIDAATPLLELYGDRDVNTFGCPELERVRDHMKRVGCRSDEPNRREKRLTITTINSRVQRIRRMFRWGVPKRLVPASVLVDLEQLEHLKRGRSRDAKDPKNVEPVSWADVQAVLPHLPPTLRAMVLVQWHSGARPSEICNLRPMDIDRSGGEVWVYRPSTHKTEHLNKVRAIPLDQEAQAALRPLLARVPPPAPEQLLFSVSQAQAERAVANRAERRTKVQPSQEDRSGGRRRASHHYTTNSYRNAIHYAIEALNGETRRRAIIDAVVGEVPSRDDGLFTRYLETLPNQIKREHIARALGRAARRSPTPSNLNRLIEVGVGALHEVKVTGFWGPHQIRHAFGFRIVPQLGVEHARALMGHSDIRTTMRYAKSDVEKAFEALYQSRG